MRRFIVTLAAVVAAVPAAAQAPDFSKVEIKTEQLAPGVAVLFGAGAISACPTARTGRC